MKIVSHVREVLTSPYYRTRPNEAIRYAYSKWVFSKSRLNDPVKFLEQHGFSASSALSGFEVIRPEMEHVLERIRIDKGQHGGISIEDGQILYGLTRALKPTYVIETGVAAGVSTSFIGAALVENGHGTLYSIELPPDQSASRVHDDGGSFDWPSHGVGWATPQRILDSLGSRRELILQDVRLALPKLLATLPHVDLFFHDDLHVPPQMQWEYDLVWPRVRVGGVMLSDDSNYAWLKFTRDNSLGPTAMLNVQRLTAVTKR